MQLSSRMRCLASLVTEGNRLADVGTDHGYVPISLVREGRIPSAVAMDVNRGPLARAEAHIRESGLSTYIETRQSDGLTRLQPGEADTVLIAGMGGMLTIRILEGGAHCLDSVKELVLQPQSDIHRVRNWLWAHGYRIVTEDIVEEDGKYYPMMRAVRGQEQKPEQAQLYYGRLDVQRSPEALAAHLKAVLGADEKVAQTLRKSGREASERMRELMESMERTNGVLETLAKRQPLPHEAAGEKERFSI